MIRTVLAAAAWLGAAAAVQAAEGDPAAGEKLSRTACAMCHKLPDGTGAQVGPAFAKIAADQAPLDAETITQVLNQPQHAPAKSQVDLAADPPDLAAYINGLE
jgi:mono/diheme cytochrome c family protein